MIAKFAGAWEDERSADEIIADIYNARSSCNIEYLNKLRAIKDPLLLQSNKK